jgi:hypothetical protein
MVALLRRVLPPVVLAVAAPLASAQDQVANPYYKFWSRSKPGATAVLKETTKLSGAAAAAAPDGTDVKTVTYKLVELNDKRAVVEARVTTREDFGYVESAPTRTSTPRG